MKNKKSKITIPKYTLAEELISSISHGIGALLSIAALVLCIVFASLHHNVLGIISSCIYGVSLIILYAMSSLYHAFKPNKAKRVFRVFDHCSIYQHPNRCVRVPPNSRQQAMCSHRP